MRTDKNVINLNAIVGEQASQPFMDQREVLECQEPTPDCGLIRKDENLDVIQRGAAQFLADAGQKHYLLGARQIVFSLADGAISVKQ